MNSPPSFLCPIGFVGGWGWVSNFNKLYFAAKTVMSFVPNVSFVITLWLCNVAFQGNSSPLKLQVYSMFALPGGCVTWLCLSTKPCDDHVSFRHKNRVGKGNLPIRSHLEPITSLKSTKKKNENVFCLSYWLHCVELKWPNASIARKEMPTFKQNTQRSTLWTLWMSSIRSASYKEKETVIPRNKLPLFQFELRKISSLVNLINFKLATLRSWAQTQVPFQTTGPIRSACPPFSSMGSQM